MKADLLNTAFVGLISANMGEEFWAGFVPEDANWADAGGGNWENNGYTIRASHETGPQPIWFAFNGALNSWHGYLAHTSFIEMDLPSPQVAERLRITVAIYNSTGPKSFRLQGWNGSGWDTLLTETDIANWAPSPVHETRSWTFANATAYDRYRLYIDANQDPDNVFIARLNIGAAAA